MRNEIIAANGDLYVVRPCTEKPGVWVEKWFPRKKTRASEEVAECLREMGETPESDPRWADLKARMDAREEADDDEPDQCMYVPGDVKDAVGQALRECEIEADDDDDQWEDDQ